VSLQADGVFLNAGAFVLASIFLMLLPPDRPHPRLFVLRAAIASALLSALFVWVSWLTPAALPSNLLVLMPARLLNFNAMTFVALVLGLSGAYRRTLWSPALSALFMTVLLLGGRSMIWDWLGGESLPWWLDSIETWRAFKVCSALLIGLGVFERFLKEPLQEVMRPWMTMRLPERLTGLARAMIVTPAVLLVAYTWHPGAITPPVMIDRTNDPLFAAVAEGQGLLLSGGNLSKVQLRTRRPVLLDGGGLDGLPYALEAGPSLERILSDVYAIDFFNPPEEARHTGVIPQDYTKTLWQNYSPERWRDIGRRYGITEILTSRDWNLDLPLAAENDDFRLYDIPPRADMSYIHPIGVRHRQ
jgi:hypothetical protein